MNPILEHISEYFKSTQTFLLSGHELKYTICLLFSLLAGFIIGNEREKKGKAAGIGTHTFVIAGSAVFSLISMLVLPTDPSRIAGTIVSGVGFLGAGMIMKNEGDNKISNLTSAAEIWYSAAIGMALGFGYYGIALVSVVFAAIVVRIPHPNRPKDVKENK